MAQNLYGDCKREPLGGFVVATGLAATFISSVKLCNELNKIPVNDMQTAAAAAAGILSLAGVAYVLTDWDNRRPNINGNPGSRNTDWGPNHGPKPRPVPPPPSPKQDLYKILDMEHYRPAVNARTAKKLELT
jgi:hypothetical protein